MISLWNVEHAARELERCRKAGLRGATIGLVPAEDLLYDSDHYERFWAACQDLAMSVNLHINSGPGRMKFSPQQRSGLMPDGAAGHKWFPGFAMRGCVVAFLLLKRVGAMLEA
jgi:predicted TIM-barrel fold metal-dependent hydrolase